MMSKTPLVSILMNCHNGEDFLSQSLSSALNQTYQNWELIFFDNASNDSSKEIFDEFCDSRFKYFYNSNKTSLADARNKAIDKALGEWIAVLDTDDSWHREKLEEQLTSLQDQNDPNKVGLIFTSAEIDFGNDRKSVSNTFETEDFLDDLLSTKLTIPWSSALFSKKLFYRIGQFDSQYPSYHDYALSLSLAEVSKVIFINKPLTCIRVHENSLSSQQKRNDGKYFLEIQSIIRKYFPRESAIEGYYILTLKSLANSFFQFNLIALIKKLYALNYYDFLMSFKILLKMLKKKVI